MSKSQPRSVLVTGASGSLGTAVCERFLGEGVEVYGTHHGHGASLNPKVHWLTLDLTQSQDVRKNLGSLDVDAWVHCAGGFRFAKTEDVSDEDLDFLLGGNLKSAFLVARELLPRMKKQGFGRIVLISSKATLQPTAGMGIYSATKSGINALTLALADEVKALDITVNAVLPTVIDTPANRKDMPKSDFSKWVSCEELAGIIFSLTQPQSKAIHGALIPVSGRI